MTPPRLALLRRRIRVRQLQMWAAQHPKTGLAPLPPDQARALMLRRVVLSSGAYERWAQERGGRTELALLDLERLLKRRRGQRASTLQRRYLQTTGHLVGPTRFWELLHDLERRGRATHTTHYTSRGRLVRWRAADAL